MCDYNSNILFQKDVEYENDALTPQFVRPVFQSGNIYINNDYNIFGFDFRKLNSVYKIEEPSLWLDVVNNTLIVSEDSTVTPFYELENGKLIESSHVKEGGY